MRLMKSRLLQEAHKGAEELVNGAGPSSLLPQTQCVALGGTLMVRGWGAGMKGDVHSTPQSGPWF